MNPFFENIDFLHSAKVPLKKAEKRNAKGVKDKDPTARKYFKITTTTKYVCKVKGNLICSVFEFIKVEGIEVNIKV